MLKAAVLCTECFSHEVNNGQSRAVPLVLIEQEFLTYRDLAFGVQGLLISCHAKSSHIRHQMSLRIEGTEEGPAKDLSIRCISVACRADTKVWQRKVPLELVGAMTIMFHTGHEGHALEITWDGQTWATP